MPLTEAQAGGAAATPGRPLALQRESVSATRPPFGLVAAPRLPSDRGRANELGLVSDDESGVFTRVAADLNTELARDRLRIRPSTSDGPLHTLDAILHRPGADVGIVQADVLEALADPDATARRHLRSIARIYDQDIHVLARADIASLRELESRAVAIGRSDSGSYITARLIFDKLGIKPTFTTHDATEALERLRSGELAAVFVLAPRPATELLGFDGAGFHLLSVPWEETILQSYRPSDMLWSDYPTLIREGERVETVAVEMVLAVYNWREGTTGHRRLARLARSFASRLGELRKPGHHFVWTDADPTAAVAGWERFHAKEEPRPISARAGTKSHPPTPSGPAREGGSRLRTGGAGTGEIP